MLDVCSSINDDIESSTRFKIGKYSKIVNIHKYTVYQLKKSNVSHKKSNKNFIMKQYPLNI